MQKNSRVFRPTKPEHEKVDFGLPEKSRWIHLPAVSLRIVKAAEESLLPVQHFILNFVCL